MNGVTSRAPTETRRILIVDDHPIVREGLSMLLSAEEDLEVCGQAEGYSQAMQQYRDTRPDLVIVDISLENGSGLELIKELVAHDPEAKVLVSSMHDESLYAERALRAGARGYVNKEESTQRMVAAVRRILAGRMYLSEQMTDRMLHRTVGAVDDQEVSPIETLSDRELQVFEHIGRGMTSRQIAEKLHLSPKTIETYREKIKLKLNLQNATELTHHAVRWVLEQEG